MNGNRILIRGKGQSYIIYLSIRMKRRIFFGLETIFFLNCKHRLCYQVYIILHYFIKEKKNQTNIIYQLEIELETLGYTAKLKIGAINE